MILTFPKPSDATFEQFLLIQFFAYVYARFGALIKMKSAKGSLLEPSMASCKCFRTRARSV